MPKQAYAFEPGGEKRLEISWKAMWKETTVTLDGTVLGVIPDVKALRTGQEFRLVDGSILKVQLVQGAFNTELRVLRSGKPLPGTASDPAARLKGAYGVLFFIAGANIILGLAAAVFQIEFLLQIGLGISSIIFGLIFLVLGFFTRRKSSLALILAIILFALDAILGVVFSVSQGYTPNTGGILVRIALLIPMIQGVGAIKALKQKPSPGANLEI